MLQVKNLGGWKSTKVAEGYVDNTIQQKKNVEELLMAQLREPTSEASFNEIVTENKKPENARENQIDLNDSIYVGELVNSRHQSINRNTTAPSTITRPPESISEIENLFEETDMEDFIQAADNFDSNKTNSNFQDISCGEKQSEVTLDLPVVNIPPNPNQESTLSILRNIVFTNCSNVHINIYPSK